MTNLKIIYNQWNKAQQTYYKPVLEALFKNRITSGEISAIYYAIVNGINMIAAALDVIAVEIRRDFRDNLLT